MLHHLHSIETFCIFTVGNHNRVHLQLSRSPLEFVCSSDFRRIYTLSLECVVSNQAFSLLQPEPPFRGSSNDAAHEVSRTGIFIIQRCCRFPECSLKNFIMESQPHYSSQTTSLSYPYCQQGLPYFKNEDWVWCDWTAAPLQKQATHIPLRS